VRLGASGTRVTGEFLEWTESNHLGHSKFAGLREDKDPRTVGKEQAAEA
jgi:ATP-dependent DNA ligase